MMSEESKRPSQGLSSQVRMYFSTITSVPPVVAELFEQYAGIPQSEQIAHIVAVRDQAYKVHSYPCLGRFRFLDLDLSIHPAYHTYILPTLTQSETESKGHATKFLDLGCCLGQDVRKIIMDGVPVPRVYGADLKPDFIDAGYALFKDEDKLPRSHFVAPADLFDTSPSNALSAAYHESITILHVSAVFHLFGWADQQRVARRCLTFLDPEARLVHKNANGSSQTSTKRAMICGADTANINAGEFARNNGITRYRHNAQSWRKLWEEICLGDKDENGNENPWKSKIKSVDFEDQLKTQERFDPKNPTESEAKPTDNEKHSFLTETPNIGQAQSEQKRKQIGDPLEGFRWHTFAIFVDFY